MPTEKRFTISDIAKEVGVSTTTVSRNLSGQYRYMTKTTREKIRMAIQKNGYRPSLVARGLKASRSYLIGVIMPQVHRTNSSHSIRNICLACSKTMYSPIIVSIEDNVDMEERRIQELLDHRVDGILTFTGSGDQYYENVAKEGIPVVRVDRCGDRRTMDSVVVNHYEVVQEALLNLSVSGYANIAIFSNRFYMSPYSTVGIRRKAYFDFMAKAEGLSPMEYIIDFNDIQSVKSAVHTYLDACVGKFDDLGLGLQADGAALPGRHCASGLCVGGRRAFRDLAFVCDLLSPGGNVQHGAVAPDGADCRRAEPAGTAGHEANSGFAHHP